MLGFWTFPLRPIDDDRRLAEDPLNDRHLHAEVDADNGPSFSLSSPKECAAALGVILGVRHLNLMWDISEPLLLELAFWDKPGFPQKHLQIILLNAKRKSLENNAYIIGFTAELQYPNQNSIEKSNGSIQFSQNGRIT